MSLLSNKVAIITGASSGIGRASAILFAREGASVVVGARRQPELDLLVEEIRHEGGQAVSLAGDVKSETYARDLVDLALTRFGGLDIAFNNAGSTGTPGNVQELELAQWQETLDTNLTSAFVGAKYQIPAMQVRGGGSLIFTSTFVGHTLGLPGMAAYAASKAGLIGLTQVLAAEYGAQGVRVNALLPGGTDTQSWPAAELRESPSRTQGVINTMFDGSKTANRPISLHVSGTNFQISVWRALLQIPPAKVVSYAQVASAVGNPKAARAVGLAVGANPVALMIPCHRVIQQNGKLGGYHWGETRKQAIHVWEAARYE